MTIEPFGANLLLFGRLLRRAGLPVHHSRLLDGMRALAWVGVRRRADVHATLLALLVHRREDIPRFDLAFDLFFRDHPAHDPPLELFALGDRPRDAAKSVSGVATTVEFEEPPEAPSSPEDRVVGAYSASGVSRTKDFADFSPEEMEEARRLLIDLPWRMGTRRTRRWERAGHTNVDLRPLMRTTLMRGEMLDLAFRKKRLAPRPIVFLGDVSGSMERYSRVLMHFVYGLAHHVRHVESFVFATTLTRITHRVAQRGSDRALNTVIREVTDWGGGTRIGESLRTFNTRWARRVMRHGPVVLLVSDGWDRGDPQRLACELGRVRRHCHRLIWLNPLLGMANYEPLTRGMQAALPHVDDFLPAHNLASLKHLAQRLDQTD